MPWVSKKSIERIEKHVMRYNAHVNAITETMSLKEKKKYIERYIYWYRQELEDKNNQ
jgi:hypothetical protein